MLLNLEFYGLPILVPESCGSLLNKQIHLLDRPSHLLCKFKVLYGRIRCILNRQIPHIGCDGVLGEGGLYGESLAFLHLKFPLKRAEANLLESDVEVFDLHVISDDRAAVPPGKAAVGGAG